MIWGGKWEGGSGLGTHVHPWWIHINVWQNQYSIVKQNKVKIKIKKKKKRDIKGLIEIDKMPHQTALIKQYLDGSGEDESEAYFSLGKIYWQKETPSVAGQVFQVFYSISNSEM